jgi:hypothetical protein
MVADMTEQDRADNQSMKVFAGRFQTEKLGLVHYPRGLGRGGKTVTFAEASAYLDLYANMLARNRRRLKRAAYAMFAGLLVGAVAAYFWLLNTAIAVLTISVGLYFAAWVSSMVGPLMFERRIRRELQRRLTSAPIPPAERIARGLAWPFWKSLLFYGTGGPLLLFLLLHRVGPNGLVSLLGPKLAQQYHVVFTVFTICLLLAALFALPYFWFTQRKRQHDRESVN